MAITQKTSHNNAASEFASGAMGKGLRTSAAMQNKNDRSPAATAPCQATNDAAGNNNAIRKIAGVNGAAPSSATISDKTTVTQPRTWAVRLLVETRVFSFIEAYGIHSRVAC